MSGKTAPFQVTHEALTAFCIVVAVASALEGSAVAQNRFGAAPAPDYGTYTERLIQYNRCVAKAPFSAQCGEPPAPSYDAYSERLNEYNRCVAQHPSSPNCGEPPTLFAAPSSAQSKPKSSPLEDAIAAYNRSDYADALTLFLPLANAGDPTAQNYLGTLSKNGLGIARDDGIAAIWYRKAADQGLAAAEFNLGTMYDEGRGLMQSYVEAQRYWSLAADQGFTQAQIVLANSALLGGDGFKPNALLAYLWFSIAATAGDRNALAERLALRANLTLNDVSTAEQLLAQCEQQNFKGCSNILKSAPLVPPPITSGDAPKIASLSVPPSSLSAPPPVPSSESKQKAIPLENDGGVYVLPVLINGVITLKFTLDSGAADVAIPADVVLTLMRTGTISSGDFLDSQTYVLADGSKVPSRRFRIRTLKIGDLTLQNVVGSVGSVNGELLLGQSFLRRLNRWSVDNSKHALIVE